MPIEQAKFSNTKVTQLIIQQGKVTTTSSPLFDWKSRRPGVLEAGVGFITDGCSVCVHVCVPGDGYKNVAWRHSSQTFKNPA